MYSHSPVASRLSTASRPTSDRLPSSCRPEKLYHHDTSRTGKNNRQNEFHRHRITSQYPLPLPGNDHVNLLTTDQTSNNLVTGDAPSSACYRPSMLSAIYFVWYDTTDTY